MKTLSKLVILTATISLFFYSCKKDLLNSPGKSRASSSSSRISSDSLTMTPFGPLAKSHVHLVENGYHLNIQNGHVLKIKTGTDEIAADFGEIKTPRAEARPITTTLTNLQSRAAKVNSGRPIRTSAPSDSSATNWEAYAQWQNTATGAPITSFSTTWTVPGNPSTPNDGQLIFIFNGMSRAEEDADIIQPVLQYGTSAAGGGNYWGISNWYAWGAGNAVYTTLISTGITTGTALTGTIKYIGKQTDSSYNYTSTFYNSSGTGYSNQLTVQQGLNYLVNEKIEKKDTTVDLEHV